MHELKRLDIEKLIATASEVRESKIAGTNTLYFNDVDMFFCGGKRKKTGTVTYEINSGLWGFPAGCSVDTRNSTKSRLIAATKI